jgi:topoisomerase IV subunit A
VYAIDYFRHILKKYGKGRERKTEIRNFDVIEAAAVAAATKSFM